MDYDSFIKNVKSTLVQAANEGKKKGIAAGIKEATDIIDKRFNEFKESLLAELNSKLSESQSEVEEDPQKENKENKK
jgi:hypothetical protein